MMRSATPAPAPQAPVVPPDLTTLGAAADESSRARLMGAIRTIFTAPFQIDPDLTLKQTIREQERQRRYAVLRLLIFVLTVIEVILSGAIIFGGAPWLTDVIYIGLICLGVGCFALTNRHQMQLAGTLYIFGTIGLLTLLALADAHGLTTWSLLTLAIVVVFVEAAALALPSWGIIVSALLGLALCATVILNRPIGLGFQQQNETAATIRYGTVGIFVFLFTLVTALSLIVLATTRAGIRAAFQAARHERDLATLKDQFIVDANHELRTPIMALYGNVELLRMLGPDTPPEVYARMLTRALESGDRLLGLLRNILDATMLESGVPQLDIQPVPLRPIVLDILETFDPTALGEPGLEEIADQARDVTVDIDAALVVLADGGRLRQVVLNLLTNALKYSPPEAPITIAAVVTPRAVQISVRDHGLGVPPQDASKLFQRFVRLERDIAGPVRGTGVGLYVCRTLVEAMEGTIGVVSSGLPGEGSTFWFTLPAAARLTDQDDEKPITAKLGVVKV